MTPKPLLIKNDPHQITNHHVPPTSTGATKFVLRKRRVEHEAYHTLFGNAATFEEAALILLQQWWRPYGQNH